MKGGQIIIVQAVGWVGSIPTLCGKECRSSCSVGVYVWWDEEREGGREQVIIQ